MKIVLRIYLPVYMVKIATATLKWQNINKVLILKTAIKFKFTYKLF